MKCKDLTYDFRVGMVDLCVPHTVSLGYTFDQINENCSRGEGDM